MATIHAHVLILGCNQPSVTTARFKVNIKGCSYMAIQDTVSDSIFILRELPHKRLVHCRTSCWRLQLQCYKVCNRLKWLCWLKLFLSFVLSRNHCLQLYLWLNFTADVSMQMQMLIKISFPEKVIKIWIMPNCLAMVNIFIRSEAAMSSATSWA